MSDVFPRRNLPEEAEQWGREHDKRVISLEGSVESIQQSLRGQNRNNASSIQTLADQVKDLVGRVGYADSSTLSANWSNSNPVPYTWGPSITFTLTEPRTVSIQTAVAGTAYALVTNNASSAVAFIRSAIFVNGALVGGARGDLGISVDLLNTPARSNSASATLISRTLISLPAGTHSVQGGFADRNVSVIGSPAAGNAYVELSNPNIFVDVLQPA